MHHICHWLALVAQGREVQVQGVDHNHHWLELGALVWAAEGGEGALEVQWVCNRWVQSWCWWGTAI